jgi:hypothetical protein
MSVFPRTRLLAIDPIRQGFAYILLESQILIDWGLVHAGIGVDASARRLDELLLRLKPQRMLIEHQTLQSKRSSRARELFVSIEVLGLSHGITVERIERSKVGAAFPESKTKHDIALALTDHYPELRTWRPRRRNSWTSEDERMNIFDALAIAEAFLGTTDHYKPSNTDAYAIKNDEYDIG